MKKNHKEEKKICLTLYEALLVTADTKGRAGGGKKHGATASLS